MTGAQMTFWTIIVGLSPVLTLVMYPGVKRHAHSKRDSIVAAFMASALFATFLGLVVSSLVNAVQSMGGS